MFGNLISPKIGISLIRGAIKKQLKKDITKFDVVLLNDADKLYFVIDGVKYEYDSDTIKMLIEAQTKNLLQKTDILTAVILKIDEADEMDAEIYLIQDGKKLILKHKF